jgi:hypothetical protein
MRTVTSPEFRSGLPRTATYARHSAFWWVFLAFLITPLAFSGAFRVTSISAQNKPEKPYALIFGTVWGPDDRPVYGVRIKIRRDRDNDKKARWELYSDHRGEFAQRVPAGKEDYVIWADLKGFKSPNGVKLQRGEEVRIHVENDERVDTGIHLK